MPILLAHRVGWPDEKLAWATLATLEDVVAANGFTRQMVFLVLPGERDGGDTPSRLYAKEFTHAFRS